jgi:hypothetical protein
MVESARATGCESLCGAKTGIGVHWNPLPSGEWQGEGKGSFKHSDTKVLVEGAVDMGKAGSVLRHVTQDHANTKPPYALVKYGCAEGAPL